MENSSAVNKVFDTGPQGARETGEEGVIQDMTQGAGGEELEEYCYE
jgi:hypothetical protein